MSDLFGSPSLAGVIDVRLIRTEYEDVRATLARRHSNDALTALEHAQALDVRLRDIGSQRDTLRARVNDISKRVGDLRREGDTAAAEALQAESRAIGETEKALADEHDTVSEALRQLLLRHPEPARP